MVFGDKGMLCLDCEGVVASEAQMTKGVIVGVIGPPLTALTGTGALCIPFVGSPFALILGLSAIAQAISSLRMAFRAEEFGIQPFGQIMLVLFSAIAILWGLVDFGIAGLVILTTVVQIISMA